MNSEMSCKHIYAIEFSLELREKAKVIKVEQVAITGCKYFKSFNLIKYGIRHNKHRIKSLVVGDAFVSLQSTLALRR